MRRFVVVGDEDPRELAALEAALLAELACEGALQTLLAGRIVRAAWLWSAPITWPPERGWGPVP